MRFPSIKLLVAALTLIVIADLLPFAAADPVIKIKGSGTLADGDGATVFRLTGTTSHLGKFACYGEIDFEPGDEGSLDGVGVVAFRAADGDMLVGEIAWHISADAAGRAAFRWRDAVTFGDGTTVESTGRFAKTRPPGASVQTTINPLDWTPF